MRTRRCTGCRARAGALVAAIEAAFPGTTGAQGVDRAALGEAVFGDPAALKRLEAIVHPAVARGARRVSCTRMPTAPLVVFDVPLLFETGGWAAVDKIVVVSAPPEVQRARVLARPGMTDERFDDDPRAPDARCRKARARRFRHPHRWPAGGNARRRCVTSSLA